MAVQQTSDINKENPTDPKQTGEIKQAKQKNSNTLSPQSYKGARDFYPEDMVLRNFIFNTWKRVLEKFGFEEYDFPILEPLEIFSAKSGEEIIRDQLFSFEDKAGRKLAVRPELTPGTVRLIVQKFKEIPQPIKWFMVGNNWRYEKPQQGRGREFNQLEVNIFGVDSNYADLEIFSIIISLMKAFGADENMFEISVSDRRIVNALLADTLQLNQTDQISVRRIMDKRSKLSKEAFFEELEKLGVTKENSEKIDLFLNSSLKSLPGIIPEEILNENAGYKNVVDLFEKLKKAELDRFCNFDPSIIRGFDYSDGLVYEVYDKNTENKRSMFGGERFDKLAQIFGDYSLPATGFAMGDYTLVEFLKNWKLIPEFSPQIDYLVTVWPSLKEEDSQKFFTASFKASEKLREKGFVTMLWNDPKTKIDKQLKYADKKGIPYVIILGESELENKKIAVKNLKNETQGTFEYDSFFSEIEKKSK